MVIGFGLKCLILFCQLPNPNQLPDFQRGLWIRAISIASPDNIPRILQVTEDLSITDVYIQIVVGGYAYYQSDYLPRSEILTRTSGPDYAPFDSIMPVLKKRGIRVHAWVNMCLAWSLAEPPESLNHVLRTHPEWFSTDVNNRNMVDYSYQDWRGFGLEGLFLDPAQYQVRQHFAKICAEIAVRYQVDGIHLDFIRYPGPFWGLEKSEASAIFAGLLADTLQWITLVRYPRLSLDFRWMVWNFWQVNQPRETAVFQAVKEVRTTLDKTGLNCALSCAVAANPAMARYRYGQQWWSWDEAFDYPVVMSYTQDVDLFTDFLASALSHRSEAVMGIGLIWPDMEPEAYWEIKTVTEYNGKGIAYFDFASIDTMVDIDKLKGNMIINEDSLLRDTTRYGRINSVFSENTKAAIINKGISRVDHGEDLEFAAFLLSLSMNPERDLARMGLTRTAFLEKINDDVAAFSYINQNIFPVGDTLLEPPRREIAYEFFAWDEGDSSLIRHRADKTRKLGDKMVVYPVAMNKLAKAVFMAEKGKKETVTTPQGIYVFKVTKIIESKKKAIREKVAPEFLPVYLNWTIQRKFWDEKRIIINKPGG